MVIWIIGKSGSGKTFLSKKLFKKLKKINKVIWIDGDKFRKKFSNDLGYSYTDRKKNSKRIQTYCKERDKPNRIVICSILSIIKKHQKENRKLFSSYIQIYIKVNLKLLQTRNNKRIYSNKRNIVGKDIVFQTPYKSDLIIKNDYSTKFLKNIKLIENKINEKLSKNNRKKY